MAAVVTLLALNVNGRILDMQTPEQFRYLGLYDENITNTRWQY